MAVKVKGSSGFYFVHLSKAEQDEVWKEINTKIKQDVFYTPQDRLKYKVISENWDNAFCKGVFKIEANGKNKTVKVTIYNEQERINKTVRSLYV